MPKPVDSRSGPSDRIAEPSRNRLVTTCVPQTAISESAEQDAGGGVRERRGHPDQEDRDAGAPRGPRGVRERHDQAEQEQHRDVVEVADVRGGEEQAGRREHREEDDERIACAAERTRTEREPGEDRDPEHQERAEAVGADAADPLQQRSGERHRHPVPPGEQVVRTPVAGDRARVVLEDHAGAPRVPGGIPGRCRERRIGDEPPPEREQEDEREADDRPPRAEPARRRGRGGTACSSACACAGERHDPPEGAARRAGTGRQDRGRRTRVTRSRRPGTDRSDRAGGARSRTPPRGRARRGSGRVDAPAGPGGGGPVPGRIASTSGGDGDR